MILATLRYLLTYKLQMNWKLAVIILHCKTNKKLGEQNLSLTELIHWQFLLTMVLIFSQEMNTFISSLFLLFLRWDYKNENSLLDRLCAQVTEGFFFVISCPPCVLAGWEGVVHHLKSVPDFFCFPIYCLLKHRGDWRSTGKRCV